MPCSQMSSSCSIWIIKVLSLFWVQQSLLQRWLFVALFTSVLNLQSRWIYVDDKETALHIREVELYFCQPLQALEALPASWGRRLLLFLNLCLFHMALQRVSENKVYLTLLGRYKSNIIQWTINALRLGVMPSLACTLLCTNRFIEQHGRGATLTNQQWESYRMNIAINRIRQRRVHYPVIRLSVMFSWRRVHLIKIDGFQKGRPFS